MAKKKQGLPVEGGWYGESAEEAAPAAAAAPEPETAPEPAPTEQLIGKVYAKVNVKNGGKRYLAGDEITDPATQKHLLEHGLAEQR